MKLFMFEFKKIAWNKKYVILLAILMCSVTFLFVRNIIFADYPAEQQKKEAALFLKRSTNNHVHYNTILDTVGEDEEILMKQELNLRVMRYAREFHDSLNSDDWKNSLFIENQLMIAIADFKATGEDFPISDYDISYRLAKNHTLLELEIPPEFESFSTSFPIFLKEVTDYVINYGGILIVLLLIGEILTREFEYKSIQLLFTQPLRRSKIIWTKYFSAVLISLITFTLLIVVTSLIGGLFGKDGSFSYPVLVEKAGEFFYMPVKDYLFYVILIFMIMLLFVIALYLFYSLLFKHILAALFAIAATLYGGYQLGSFINWQPLAWLNPFQYLFPQDAVLNQNYKLFYQGIPVTISLTVVLLTVSVIMLRKEKLG